MELIRIEEYHFITGAEDCNIPELAQPIPEHTITVPWGQFGTGDITNTFASTRFWNCSGFILASPDMTQFGLLHSNANRGLTTRAEQRMAAFRRGVVLPIEGSRSTDNPLIKRDFARGYRMKVLDPLQFDVDDDFGEVKAFHLVFRPGAREILVVREAKKDVLVYRGL